MSHGGTECREHTNEQCKDTRGQLLSLADCTSQPDAYGNAYRNQGLQGVNSKEHKDEHRQKDTDQCTKE